MAVSKSKIAVANKKRSSIELDKVELLDREDLLKIVKGLMGQGVTVSYYGKWTAREIERKVRPRVTRRIADLCVGSPEEQAKNLIIEGDNLHAMVTLYKYRGQIDLIVADPPYNTGRNFRYNDKWEVDPNDPDPGTVVTLEDGSRHTKWMKAMLPRLHMMKRMLKPNGVLAMCIDDNELFHLGMMLDEVFGEQNRLAVINWQKSYSPKNDSAHVSTGTEYVLVYAKDKERASTARLDRTEAMDARYTNPDQDPEGSWKAGDLSAKAHPKPEDYGIQSPFTGVIHYPPGTRRWHKRKSDIKSILEKWGTPYVEIKDPNCTLPSLVLKGTRVVDGQLVTPESILKSARRKALKLRDTSVWPEIVFLADGEGTPALKKYLKSVKRGRVPMTYWADEEYEEPIILDSQSWNHPESGHSQSGQNELDAIVGRGHGFETVKPLKLIKKIIHLWCPPNGLVLDPYAGSGTTGHAVLELNSEIGTDRRFVMVEQGRPDTDDNYTRTLTYLRLSRVITGERPVGNGEVEVSAQPIGGGFEFRVLTKKIDAMTVMSMKRDELVDVVITSHWDSDRRNAPNLIPIDDANYKYLVGKNDQGEGYFIIWNGSDEVGQLDLETYQQVLSDASLAEIKPPYHVYARYEVFQSPSVRFYKIPDKILAHLGLNINNEPFNETDDEQEEGDDQ